MDIDMVAGMKVDELKAFLRLRGLKTSGKKQELVARVFVAIENKVEVIPTAQQIEKQLSNDYMAKLKIEGTTIPDPFQLNDCWLDEDNGMKYWPTTMYPDIFNFLAFHPAELASKDLSDYKTSKAYSYYSDGWLGKLQYNEINQQSKYCLIKTTCRPSQRINDTPHKLWVCLNKKDGKILTSHCTCMAGMSETCNHVAAALFRIEAAVRLGLTSPSCTSSACSWLPSTKVVRPERVENMKWSRSDFGKRGKKGKELNSSPKKNYDPVHISGNELQLKEIADALKVVCNEKESIIFSAFPKDKVVSDEGKSQEKQPLSLNDVVEMSNNEAEFFKNMGKLNKKEIEKATRGQSDNPLWHLMRRHIISGSKAHEVKTKMQSLQKKDENSVSMTPVFDKVSGNSHVNPEIPALKYGRAMEKEAIASFTKEFKEKHTGVKVLDCGLFIVEDMPYVGGSPDGIIMCDCCGLACLEVKSPFSVRHTSPEDPQVKLQYLVRGKENELRLNRNHQYYTQCQVEMVATQCPTCYFYVWTPQGSFTECLELDERLWEEELKPIFTKFYTELYIPTLFV